MNAQDLWNEYKTINPSIGDEIDAWSYGVLADELADLTRRGVKTATASAYDLYTVDGEDLPKVGTYQVVLDSKDEAVCIIKETKVSVQAFCDVSTDHAYKEGEGDRSLDYWRQVHWEFFTKWCEECGISFTETSKVVLEEFEVVYPLAATKERNNK